MENNSFLNASVNHIQRLGLRIPELRKHILAKIEEAKAELKDAKTIVLGMTEAQLKKVIYGD